MGCAVGNARCHSSSSNVRVTVGGRGAGDGPPVCVAAHSSTKLSATAWCAAAVASGPSDPQASFRSSCNQVRVEERGSHGGLAPPRGPPRPWRTYPPSQATCNLTRHAPAGHHVARCATPSRTRHTGAWFTGPPGGGWGRGGGNPPAILIANDRVMPGSSVLSPTSTPVSTPTRPAPSRDPNHAVNVRGLRAWRRGWARTVEVMSGRTFDYHFPPQSLTRSGVSCGGA